MTVGFCELKRVVKEWVSKLEHLPSSIPVITELGDFIDANYLFLASKECETIFLYDIRVAEVTGDDFLRSSTTNEFAVCIVF